MAAQQQQSSGGDNSLAPLWIIIAILAAGAVIWYSAQEYIVAFVLKLRLFEIYLVGFFTNSLAPVASSVRATPPSAYSGVSFNDLVDLSNQVGVYLCYPIAGILVLLAVYLYWTSPLVNLKKIYSMQTLLEAERLNWPQATPVVKLDLAKQHVDEGIWRMGLTPMQFAKEHKLIIEEYTTAPASQESVGPKLSVSLNRGEAYRVYALQLGRYWQGVEYLPVYARALFAIFAARVGGDRPGAQTLTDKIADSMSKGALDFSGVDVLLAKHKDNKHVIKLTQRHAFEATVMASMLLLARDDGVLAAADFIWLKPVDRTLWYVLNSVGRKTPFVEVGGIFAHWVAELRYGKAIKTPMIDTALDGLELALKEVLYKPDSEE